MTATGSEKCLEQETAPTAFAPNVRLAIYGQDDASAIYSQTTAPADADDSEVTSLGQDAAEYGTQTENNDGVLVITWDDSFLRTCPGMARVFLLLCSLIALLCLVTSGTNGVDYLQLPLHVEIRIDVFFLVLTILCVLLCLILQVTTLSEALTVNWNLFDLVLYSIFLFGHFIGSTLVANGIMKYHDMYQNLKLWTYEQLIIAVVCGYVSIVLCSYIIFHSWRVLKGFDQYNRQRLHNIATVSIGA